ncbi:hypothetical protein [Tahibacter caeni]|uniref:hypothetical protein n=1 Tax=Tahibacter caeni TaxID=1453545 RepID=UPI0021497D8A|nr:hypothetical protein [Tahibacter caeni]
MTSADPLPPPGPSPQRFTFANVSSALALAVSVFALAISAYQTRLMQSQARAAVWPYLAQGSTYAADDDAGSFVWLVENNGVGPARIKSVALTLDGKPMRNWNEALAALGVSGKTQLSLTRLSGEVIPPSLNRETGIPLIRVDGRDIARLLQGAQSRFRLDVCYCSVYGDCWLSRWQTSGAEPLAHCTAPAVPFED